MKLAKESMRNQNCLFEESSDSCTFIFKGYHRLLYLPIISNPKTMILDSEKLYFLAVRDDVLRNSPKKSTSRNAVNHLILGEDMNYLDETDGEWAIYDLKWKEKMQAFET